MKQVPRVTRPYLASDVVDGEQFRRHHFTASEHVLVGENNGASYKPATVA